MVPKNNRTIRGTHYFPEMHTPGQIIDITDEIYPLDDVGPLVPGSCDRMAERVSGAPVWMAVLCSLAAVLIIAALISLFR